MASNDEAQGDRPAQVKRGGTTWQTFTSACGAREGPTVFVHGSIPTGDESWQAQRPLADHGFRLLVP